MRLPSVLERLAVDPRPNDFFDELWDELRVRESARARRWRLVAVVACVIAVAAVSAGVVAAVSRAKVLDKTLTCTVPPHAGVRQIGFGASTIQPGRPDPSKPFPGMVSLAAPGAAFYLAFDSSHSGYTLEHALCRKAPAFPLGASGLPSGGVYTDRDYKGLGMSCVSRGRLVFRIRLRMDSEGVPSRAQIAIRLGRRPIAYVDWSPRRETTYATAAALCTVH